MVHEYAVAANILGGPPATKGANPIGLSHSVPRSLDLPVIRTGTGSQMLMAKGPYLAWLSLEFIERIPDLVLKAVHDVHLPGPEPDRQIRRKLV